MPVSGGPLIPVAERVANVPGSVLWLDDNTIVYAANEGRKLVRVPADGGAGTVIWASDSLLPMSLSGLPDSRGVLFQACRAPCDQAGTGLWVVDLRSRAARQLAPRVRTGQYLASGHLALVRDDQNVTVVPFDLRSLQVRGAPTTVLDGVAMPGGMPYFSVSAGGTLVMRQGVPPESRMYELVWVDRAGRQSLVDSSFTFKVTQFAGNYGWALSPDGGRLAIGLNTIEGDDIWIKSLPRGAVSRVTFGAASVSRPRWLPDGRSVTFVAQGDAGGVFIRRTDGTGKDSLLWRGSVDEAAYSPDHRWLVIRKGAVSATAGGRDIFGVQLGVDTTLVPLIATAYDEHAFSISPDGRWIIYQSDETGRLEVFIRPFPNTGDTKVQVSIGGGTAPLWSRNGRELFYLRPDNRMMAVSVPADPVLRLGDPQVLFEVPAALTILASSYYTPWDVGPDGRFIFARPVENATQPDSPLIVVENWTEEVKLKVRR
jgi:serine/threonine-protein kinase